MIRIFDVTVCGFNAFSFTGKDGKPVNLVTCYFTGERDGCSGQFAGSFNVSDNRFVSSKIGVGSTVQVAYADKKFQLIR